MRKNSHPRVTKIERTSRMFIGRCKKHLIQIDRTSCLNDWYIMVRAPDGCYLYDGWWYDSCERSMDDAIVEACTGAMLWEKPVEQAA